MRMLITGFVLSFAFVSASFSADMGEIKCGETKSGTIAELGQEDVWTFTAQAGQRVIIDVETASGSMDTYILLYSPSQQITQTILGT